MSKILNKKQLQERISYLKYNKEIRILEIEERKEHTFVVNLFLTKNQYRIRKILTYLKLRKTLMREIENLYLDKFEVCMTSLGSDISAKSKKFRNKGKIELSVYFVGKK